jgi:hypothetical protein
MDPARDNPDVRENREQRRVLSSAESERAYEQAVALRDACVRFARNCRSDPGLELPSAPEKT